MSFARAVRFDDKEIKNKENTPGPDQYNPRTDNHIRGFTYRDQSILQLSSICGNTILERSMDDLDIPKRPPQSTPVKNKPVRNRPFGLNRRRPASGSSCPKPESQLKVLMEEHQQLKIGYQKIKDTCDELEQAYFKEKSKAEQIPNLTKKVDELTMKLENAKAHGEAIGILEEQIKAFQAKEEELIKERTDRESQLLIVRGRCHELELRITELEATIKKKSDDLQTQNLKLFGLQTDIGEMASVKKQLNLAKEDNAVYISEMNGLKETLTESHASLGAMRSENHDLKSSIAGQMEEVGTYIERMKILEFDRDESIAVNADIREDLSVTQMKVRDLLEDLKSKDEVITSLKDEVQCFTQKILSLEESAVSGTHQRQEDANLMEKLTSQVAQLTERISEMSTSKTDLEAELANVREDLHDGKKKGEELAAIIKDGGDQVEAMSVKLREAESTVEELGGEKLAAESVKEEMAAKIVKLKLEVEETREKDISTFAEIQKLRDDNYTLVAKVDSAQKSSHQKDKEFIRLCNEKKKIMELNEQLKTHGRSYMLKRNELRDANSSLNNLLGIHQRKLSDLEAFKRDHQATLTSLQTKLRLSETEKQTLRTQISSVERDAKAFSDKSQELLLLEAKLAESELMSDKWKAMYEELEDFVSPIRQDLAKKAEESAHWGSENQKKTRELALLNAKEAESMGHANHKQKLKYMTKIKDENEMLKSKLSSTECEMKKLRRENEAIRDDLSVVRNVRRFDPKKAFQH